MPQKFGHGFGAGADLELLVDAADVGVDGLVADAQFVGDLLVEEALAQQIQHFLLARGKGVAASFGLRSGAGFLEGLHDLARDVRGHGGTAATDLADGLQQFARAGRA